MTNPTNPEVAILNAALELPVDQRAAYLDKACAGDVVLRVQVEALLGLHGPAAGFLEGSSATFDFKRTVRPNIPLTEKPGDRIGRYKLLQQIGEGGCGVVYMAEQEEPVRRRVALKVIKLGMDTKSVIARFEAERQALAMMDHPNIAKVLDAGATETGRPYFVMELVRGVKITTYCDQQKLAVRQRLDLFIQVCQAVQHAHQKGIIHRDLKPSNILVTEQDGAPVPKIIDFGIAKATTDQRLTDKTLFTAFEQFLGTPAYMSPEQAGLGGLDIDTRSDIYSLGVLLYELLTGHPPFDAEQFSRSALHEILRVIRENEPPRPSARLTTLSEQELTTAAQRRQIESAKLPNLVRGDLDWIVMKALDKDRTRRYETANGFARDLQRFLDNEAVVARPPSNFYRLQKLVRRNKLAFTAVGAVTVALLLGLGVSTWALLKEREARQQAEADKQAAKVEALKGTQVAQFLQDMLQGIGPSVTLGRDTKLLREILDNTAKRISNDLIHQPEVAADLRVTIGHVYVELGDYSKAEEMLRPAIPLYRKLGFRRSGGLAASLRSLGVVLTHQGNLPEAEALGREALDLMQKRWGNESKELAMTLNDLAITLKTQGKLTEAEKVHREALAMDKKLLGNEHRTVADDLNNLANALSAQGKLAEAEAMHREALAMRIKLLGNEHPDVAMSLHNLADVLLDQGKLAEAETTQREALAQYRKFHGDEHPATVKSFASLTLVLSAQGKLAEAEATNRVALNIVRKLWPDGHLELADSLDGLADVLGKQGKFTEAESMYREALVMLKKLLGNEHLSVATSLRYLAEVLVDQEKFEEAETVARQALEVRKKLLDDDSSEMASLLDLLGAVIGSQGRLAEAETMQRQALEMKKKLHGIEHQNVAASFHNLANVLKEQGKLAEAEEMYRQALEIYEKMLGKEHPTVAFPALHNLIAVLVAEDKLAEAETMSRRALEIGKKTMGEDPRLGLLYSDLADVLRREHKYDEAEQVFNDIRTPAAASEPQSAGLLDARGDFHASTGRWKEATADFSRVIEFKPDYQMAYHSLASLLVQTGQLDAYREHCRKSVERFGNTTDWLTAHCIAKDCLILPSSVADRETVTRMADTTVAVGTNQNALPFSQCTKGWDEYRRGHFVSAVEWTQKAVASEKVPFNSAQAYLVMAMAKQQLGQGSEARAALSKAIEIAGTKLQQLESGEPGDGWRDWIIIHSLVGEAKALIDCQSATATKPN